MGARRGAQVVSQRGAPVSAPILVSGAAGFIGMHVCSALLDRGADAGVIPHRVQVDFVD